MAQLSRSLLLCIGCHHLLYFSNSFPRIQPLGAGPRAVHDGVASVQREGVLQLGLALREVVSGVDHPAIGLPEDRGAQVLVSIPPVARAAGTAAGAENTLIEPVQFLTVSYGLHITAPCLPGTHPSSLSKA